MSALRLGWSLRALGGQLGAQWERDRRDTLFLMATIALAVLPHVAHQPLWITGAFAAMFGWRLALVFSGRELPGPFVRTVGAIACLAAIFAQYQSLIGREQGVAMLTLFLGLKLLEMKARRDLFVAIFLCFFLLLTSFFHSQSLASAMLVGVAVIALTATMITMQYGQQEAAIAQRYKQALLMLVQALPIALALFVLFPRLATPLWGMQGQGGSSTTGLSDSMAPGGVTSLSKSTAVAMRVKFDGAVPPAPQLYWRGPVFGAFDGTTWSAFGPSPGSPRLASLRTGAPADLFSYEVTLEPNGQPWLLALDMPVRVAPLPASKVGVGSGFTLLRDHRVFERLRYRIDSHLDYELGAELDPSELQPWLHLPLNFNPRTLALARQWRDEMTGLPTMQVVDRALSMFRTQAFRYTLNPPALGRHSVDEFLFDQQAGFCEHFTSAFVVLMRAIGIPARVVTGYQGGTVNPLDGYMVVRQSDAHAWAEVWTERQGWVRVDPTAAVAPERIETDQRLVDETDFGAPSGTVGTWALLKLNLDALANRWNQWVLNYDRRSQGRLLESLGLDGQDWTRLAALLAGAMVLLIGGSALLTLQPRPVGDPLAKVFEQFCQKMAVLGVARLEHETPGQYLERSSRHLSADALQQARGIVALYTQLRYGAMSGVYQGKERRRRSRASKERARHIAKARQGLRELRASVQQFGP